MAGKKFGNSHIGGDKKTRDKINRNNPRDDKKGGRKSILRYKNTILKNKLEEKNPKR